MKLYIGFWPEMGNVKVHRADNNGHVVLQYDHGSFDEQVRTYADFDEALNDAKNIEEKNIREALEALLAKAQEREAVLTTSGWWR